MAGIDPLFIFTSLFREGLDGENINPESQLSESSIDRLPIVVYTFIGSGQSLNGPGLWPGSLILNVMGSSLDEATAAMRTVYDLVTSWGKPENGIVDGQGAVEIVEDESLFSLSPKSTMIGKDVSQYDGSFGVSLRTFN